MSSNPRCGTIIVDTLIGSHKNPHPIFFVFLGFPSIGWSAWIAGFPRWWMVWCASEAGCLHLQHRRYASEVVSISKPVFCHRHRSCIFFDEFAMERSYLIRLRRSNLCATKRMCSMKTIEMGEKNMLVYARFSAHHEMFSVAILSQDEWPFEVYDTPGRQQARARTLQHPILCRSRLWYRGLVPFEQ